jgi:hypothetical protein
MDIENELYELMIEAGVPSKEFTISGNKLKTLSKKLEDTDGLIREKIKDLKRIEKQIQSNFKADTIMHVGKKELVNGKGAAKNAEYIYRYLTETFVKASGDVKLYKIKAKKKYISKTEYDEIVSFIHDIYHVEKYVTRLDKATNDSSANKQFKFKSDINDIRTSKEIDDIMDIPNLVKSKQTGINHADLNVRSRFKKVL